MTHLEGLLIHYKMQLAALMRGFDDMRYDLSNEQINSFLDEKARIEKLINILEIAIEQEKNNN